jgi:hypothetical protein
MLTPKEVKGILKKYSLTYADIRNILNYCVLDDGSYFSLEITGIHLLKQMSNEEQKIILEYYFFDEYDIITLIEINDVIYVKK